MNKKFYVLVLVLALASCNIVSISPVAAHINRPIMDKMLITIYHNSTSLWTDFNSCSIEITGWPASRSDLLRCINNPNVTLRSYSEIGLRAFVINNQRWPCGWDTPKELDPDTDSYKHYMNLSDMTNINCRRDWCAQEFRKALCYLTDKASYVRNILGGLGYAVETFCPIPALEGYTDYAGLDAKGLIYWYNPVTAAAVLGKAGFRDLDGDGYRDDWQDPGKDLAWGTSDDGAVEIDSLRKYNAGGLVFYSPIDDSNRNQAGFLLCAEMQKLKIPVKIISTERTVCWRQCMVLYDYDLYVGDWRDLNAVPTWLHTIFNSEYYWSPIGWSSNYMGWCYKPYDAASFALYSATTPASFLANALLCQELIAEYTAIIPLWSMVAVKGFKTGYTNVVADIGYGVDNYYSFALMNDTRAGKDRTIDYGLYPDIDSLNVISANGACDWKVIGLTYESMIGRKPYDKAIGSYDYWLATGYTIGTWGTKGYTEVNFTIRTGVKWQDEVGFTPDDVVFSLNFTRNCGKGVAWNFATVQYLNKTWAEGNKVIVRFNVASPLLAQEWAGFLPIIPKHIWEAKYPNWQDWFNEATGIWSDARMVVRDWKFWFEDSGYSGVNGYVSNATGTGAWIFDSHTEGQYIAFHANKVYYRDYDSLLADVKQMFWAGMGDANKNMKVDGPDLAKMHLAWGSTPASSNWDPDCDFNNDLAITGSDYKRTIKNYGRPG
jgi:ABC-type transport system substrate-binding protein